MGLLLPLVLLGFAVPVDQTPRTPEVVPPRTFTLESAPPRNFSLSPDSRFVPVPEIPARAADCFTVRSYYFQRQDDLAPEYVGMTTCEPSRSVQEKRAFRRPARLVPASDRR